MIDLYLYRFPFYISSCTYPIYLPFSLSLSIFFEGSGSPSAKLSSQLTTRVVLILLISLAVHAIFLVEQPDGSGDVFPLHPRFNWLCNRVARVPILHKCVK